MSHWNLRVLAAHEPAGEVLTVHEVQYANDGTIFDYNREPALADGESIAEIAQQLLRMREALSLPVLRRADLDAMLDSGARPVLRRAAVAANGADGFAIARASTGRH